MKLAIVAVVCLISAYSQAQIKPVANVAAPVKPTVSAAQPNPDQDPCVLSGQALMDSLLSEIIAPTSNDVLVQSLQLSPQMRLQIMCDLKKSFQERYVSYYLKKTTAGTDLEKNFNLCAWRETQTTDTSRIGFSDRVLECLAKTHDSHVYGALATPRPVVATVFDMANVQGKAVISILNQRLIARLKQSSNEVPSDLDDILALGNEVLEVDGVPTVTAALNLRRFVSASSVDFADYYSYGCLTMRDFAYPTSPLVEFKIKKADGTIRQLAFPWWSYFTNPDVEAEAYFNQLGIPKVSDMQWVYDKASHRYAKDPDTFDIKGWGFSIPLYTGTSVKTYLGATGAATIRYGVIANDKNQKFCYLQIRSFIEKEMTLSTDETVKMSFLDALKTSILDCKKAAAPMVLDLRSNPGGNGDYPPQLISMLARTGESVVGTAQTLRADRISTETLNDLMDPDRIAFTDLDNPSVFSTVGLEAYKAALRNHLPMMDWVYNKDIPGDKNVNGFDAKILALVTPACVSACDMTSRLLKNSKRATLVGSHANGTGAGFMGDSSILKDSLGVLNVEIPNFMFTVLPAKTDSVLLPFANNTSLIMENSPTMADVTYEPTVNDVMNSNQDLKTKLNTLLFQ